MHRKVAQVDQIDSLAVSLHQEGERSYVKSGQSSKICALRLVLHRAVNFYERSLPLVDKADPGDAPATNSEFVCSYFDHLGDQMVHKQEVR